MGRWKKVPGTGRCSGLATCSGFGACAHIVRLVRVDVAVGELHVAVVNAEAAAVLRFQGGFRFESGIGRQFRGMRGGGTQNLGWVLFRW